MNQEEKKLINLLLKDPEINNFCKINCLTGENILNNLGKFVIQRENNRIYQDCNKNDCDGLHTQLEYNDNKVELSYIPCPNLEMDYHNNLDLQYFPNSGEFLKKEPDITPARAGVLRQITKFTNEYKKGKFTKGIYFYGHFGTGKTFLMMKLAKNLSEKGAKVFIAYYPDLTRHLRSSVATGELEKMIIKLKNYDILMLDDIGADTNSAFIRDEILGPVLQYRLHANLPVCMTSNFSFSELRNHFMESKNDLDVLKSDRIIERLRYLMTEVKLADRNYRTGVEYQKKD